MQVKLIGKKNKAKETLKASVLAATPCRKSPLCHFLLSEVTLCFFSFPRRVSLGRRYTWTLGVDSESRGQFPAPSPSPSTEKKGVKPADQVYFFCSLCIISRELINAKGIGELHIKSCRCEKKGHSCLYQVFVSSGGESRERMRERQRPMR